jgi:hypothetical protein
VVVAAVVAALAGLVVMSLIGPVKGSPRLVSRSGSAQGPGSAVAARGRAGVAPGDPRGHPEKVRGESVRSAAPVGRAAGVRFGAGGDETLDGAAEPAGDERLGIDEVVEHGAVAERQNLGGELFGGNGQASP